MPCSDAGYDEYHNKRRYGVYASSADIAAMAACEACRIIDMCEDSSLMSKFLRNWWKDHKKWDKENR